MGGATSGFGAHVQRRWRLVVVVAVSALLLARLWPVLVAGQWDFITYYHAAVALRRGLDPYSLADLQQVAGSRVDLRYLYPPAFLYAIQPLTWCSLETAKVVYLVAKLVALVALVQLWRRFLGHRQVTLTLFAVTVVGFSGSLFMDLYAGNVSVFEQLLLWAGFLALSRGRPLVFVVCVVLCSAAKITPLAFLLLLLFSEHRRRLALFGAGVVSGVGLLVASFGADPARIAHYLRVAAALDERGHANPSSLAFCRDLADAVERATHGAVAIPADVVYAVAAIALLAGTALILARWWRRRHDDPSVPTRAVLAATLLYALVVPRFKDYSYLLLVPAATHVLAGHRSSRAPLFILLALGSTDSVYRYLLGGFPFGALIRPYHNLIVVAVLWAMMLVEDGRRRHVCCARSS